MDQDATRIGCRPRPRRYSVWTASYSLTKEAHPQILGGLGGGVAYLHDKFHLDPSSRLATVTSQQDRTHRTDHIGPDRANRFTNGRPKTAVPPELHFLTSLCTKVADQ